MRINSQISYNSRDYDPTITGKQDLLPVDLTTVNHYLARCTPGRQNHPATIPVLPVRKEGKAIRYLNCDLEEERQAGNHFTHPSDRLVAGKDVLLIDEVKRLDQPGLTLKILVDLYPELMLLVTGSSSFELRNRLSEAMTG